MNKDRRVEVKKTLVRNAFEKPQQKSKIILEPPRSSALIEESKEIALSKSNTEDTEKSKKHIQFDTPELQSTLKLSNKIDEIVNLRKTKSSSVDKKKLAVDEKVTRKVNFPYDQAIYKNLIPLTCDRVQSQPILSSRGPLPQKDREPVLSDFIEPKKVYDYYYLPTIKLDNRTPHFSCDNIRLYRLLEKNNID